MENRGCNMIFSDCCQEEKNESVYQYEDMGEHVPNETYYDGENNYAYEHIERPVLHVQGDQPVFNIPVYQDKYIRDKIIETQTYEVQDIVQPKCYLQETKHDIPTVELFYKEKNVAIPQEQVVEKIVEVDTPIGYSPVYSPVWDVREIPRVVPKYEGEQKIIQVEVPQIKYIDKYVEKEIVVDVKEKIVPKITEIEKEVDIVKYEWKEKYQDVPVCKYVPKIDVELDCPPPLIVPYPEVHFQNISEVMNPNQRLVDISNETLLKNTVINNPTLNKHVDKSVKQNLINIAKLTNKKKNEQNLRKKKKKSWGFCYFNRCNADEDEYTDNEEVDPKTGYPKKMPKDFASYFKKDLNTVKKQMGIDSSNISAASNNKLIEKGPLNVGIEYLGKIDKAPVDGGRLESISFKLHAIEVHQFIPVPTLPKPKFLDIVSPEQFENNDISSLKNIFGTVSEDWVDPIVTGYIAPMMKDVLHGNTSPKNPLFNKLTNINNNDRIRAFASMHSTHNVDDNSKYDLNDYNLYDGNQYHIGDNQTHIDDNQNHTDDNQQYQNYGSQNSFVSHNNYASMNHINENQELYTEIVN
ncbi:conserved protein, unknown function [Hepatocystis sp. ex Piliocolobus tephrosceles]|nr:conserved protein, unknown function [Hepatocystis sp. ex Piliocolobus tephrosceles]